MIKHVWLFLQPSPLPPKRPLFPFSHWSFTFRILFGGWCLLHGVTFFPPSQVKTVYFCNNKAFCLLINLNQFLQGSRFRMLKEPKCKLRVSGSTASKTAKCTGLPVLSSSPVWTIGKRDSLLQENNWLQGNWIISRTRGMEPLSEERVGVVQSREEKALDWLDCSLSVPKGDL